LQRQFETLFLHIFCALHCLQRAGGILHNDLHLDNILMVSGSHNNTPTTAATHLAYIVGEQYCLVRNNLGEALGQLPVLCDFALSSSSSSGATTGNLALRNYYCETQRCAYHNSTAQRRARNCSQTALCDVRRLLNETFAHLQQHSNVTDIVMRAFAPFNRLRMQLNAQHQRRCVPLVSLPSLLTSTFAFTPLPIVQNSSLCCVYDCNRAAPTGASE
jgi:serine/threonine protein kinase